MGAERVSYVKPTQELNPFNPILDQEVGAEIKRANFPGVSTIVIGGKQVASSEYLAEFPEELHEIHALSHSYIGGYAGGNGAILSRVLLHGLTHKEFGAKGNVISAVHEGRDDSEDSNGNARGRRAPSETLRQTRELKGNLSRPLDLALVWGPHSEYTRQCYSELVKDGINGVISLSSYRHFAEMFAGKIDTLLGVDRSSTLRQIYLCRAIEDLTGKRPEVFFHDKERFYNDSNPTQFFRITKDNFTVPADPEELVGANIGSLDDVIDTGGSMRKGVFDYLQMADTIHIAAETVLMSGNGEANMIEMLNNADGRVNLYTTDLLPFHKKIVGEDGKPHENLHIHTVAPALAALTRVLTGRGYLEDTVLVRSYLQGPSPDKQSMNKSKETNLLPIEDRDSLEKLFDFQIDRIQTTYAVQERIFQVA